MGMDLKFDDLVFNKNSFLLTFVLLHFVSFPRWLTEVYAPISLQLQHPHLQTPPSPFFSVLSGRTFEPSLGGVGNLKQWENMSFDSKYGGFWRLRVSFWGHLSSNFLYQILKSSNLQRVAQEKGGGMFELLLNQLIGNFLLSSLWRAFCDAMTRKHIAITWGTISCLVFNSTVPRVLVGDFDSCVTHVRWWVRTLWTLNGLHNQRNLEWPF